MTTSLSPDAGHAAAVTSPAASSPARAGNYALAILTTVFCIQYLDRQLVVILAEPIRAEFGLSDAQLGLLAGLIYSVPYSLVLLPVGLMVDRFNRRNLLAGALAIWSGLTFFTGLAGNFLQLAVARTVIGASEAVNNPAGLSLLTDHFPLERRAKAFGIVYAGQGVATLVGFTTIGVLATAYGWRVAFFAAGAPGLLLALLMFLTMREPQRDGGEAQASPRLATTLRFIRSQPSLVHLMAGMIALSAAASGHISWMTSYLMRAHGMDLVEASFVISVSFGLAVIVGKVVGGYAIDALGRRNSALIPLAIGLSTIVVGAAMVLSVLSPNSAAAVFFIVVWALASGGQIAPAMGLQQLLVTPRMRGVTMSMTQLLINLIGAGLGPLLVGLCSDHLGPYAGEQAMSWGLVIVAQFAFLGSFHFLRAGKTLTADIERSTSFKASNCC